MQNNILMKRIIFVFIFLILFTSLALGSLYFHINSKYDNIYNDYISSNSLRLELGYEVEDESIFNKRNITDLPERINKLSDTERVTGELEKLETEKDNIVLNFDIFVSNLQAEFSSYPITLDFIPADTSNIKLIEKKDVNKFNTIYRTEFRNKVVEYNKNNTTLIRPIWDVGLELELMTYEEKLSQMVVFGIPSTSLGSTETLIRNFKPGGVVFLGENISNNLLNFTNELQLTNPTHKLFISTDQEGGLVKRIWWDETLAPRDMGNTSAEDVCNNFQSRDNSLAELGINLNLGIVADYTTDSNSFIYWRTYSNDLNKVNEVVSQGVKCSTKTLNTVKHFPGHGGTTGDTHVGVEEINLTKEQWEATHLQPFKTAIDSGAKVIMIGHLKLMWVDSKNPASLSKKVIDYLRNELEFKGLIITDDVNMLTAAGYSLEDATIRAIEAGNDLLLFSNYGIDLNPMFASIIEKKVNVSDETVRRILEGKNSF